MDCNNDQHALIGSVTLKTRDVLLKLAIDEASLGHYVLYLTAMPFKSLPKGIEIALDNGRNSAAMKNIIFMYPPSLKELIGKLGTLHNWVLTPSLIILDSLNAFTNSSKPETTLHNYALALVTLHDLSSSFRATLRTNKCITVCSLDLSSITADKLNTLIRLFYYENNYINKEGAELEEILKKIIKKA